MVHIKQKIKGIVRNLVRREKRPGDEDEVGLLDAELVCERGTICQ